MTQANTPRPERRAADLMQRFARRFLLLCVRIRAAQLQAAIEQAERYISSTQSDLQSMRRKHTDICDFLRLADSTHARKDVPHAEPE